MLNKRLINTFATLNDTSFFFFFLSIEKLQKPNGILIVNRKLQKNASLKQKKTMKKWCRC